MKKILFAALAAVVLLACNTSYDKSPSGLVYKIYPGPGGPKLKGGEYIKFNIRFTLPDDKDTVLSDTWSSVPGFLAVDTTNRSDYSFMEVMRKCSVGDSAVVIMKVDSLVAKKAIGGYTEILKKGATLKCVFKVLKSYANEEEVTKDYRAEIEKLNEQQKISAEAYAKAKGYNNLKKTTNGVVVEIDNIGDTSNMVDSNKLVSVMYKGYLQENGKVFDTNMDSSKGHTDPYSFVVGRRGAIEGWDEGLRFFGNGGEGKLVIPAFLGYGAQGSPPDIPANANLVFEIKMVDVKPAPPMPDNSHRRPELVEPGDQ